MYELPTSFEVGGAPRSIRFDYRAVLDICTALTDPELNDGAKAQVLLEIFYPDWEDISPADYKEAIEKCLWFINGGVEDKSTKRKPKLMDWKQDFSIIVAPINRVIGQEIRAIPYDRVTNTGGLHWWTFLSAYNEVGDCLFAQIVRIRNLKAKGKKLSKEDQQWYKDNRELVDFKTTYTQAEQDLLAMFSKKPAAK